MKTLAPLLLAGSLVLSGCSLLPGDDADGGGGAKDPEPTSAPTTRKDGALPSTAWQSAAAGNVAQGGTLRLGAAALPRNFNPEHPDAASSDAGKILAPTVGNAVRITAGGDWEVDEDYAESVEVTDKDPLTVKVRLNPDAVWQGGTSITAKDMVAYWKAMNGSDDAYEVVSTEGFEDIEDVESGKSRFDYTVTFYRPNAEWPRFIYPRLAAKVTASPKLFNDGFRRRAISSNGPFVVAGIDRDKGTITQRPNPRWWGQRPKLKTITWQVADPGLQAEAFAAGDLDAIDLDATNHAAADEAEGGSVQRAAGIEWSQVTLNGGRGPLEDADVRRAVAHAIDRDAIARRTARELGSPPAPLGSLILVPGQRGYTDSADAIAYDPTRAASLLAKAGWKKRSDGSRVRKGDRLRLTMPIPSDIPANRSRARLIAADLDKVGIDLRLRTVPAKKFFDQYVIALDFDLVTFVWRASAFPIGPGRSLFYPVDSAQNFTGLGDKRVGDRWDTATETLDDDRRFKRVANLDERLLKDVPMVPLAVTPIAMAVRDGLVNYGAAQFEQTDWTTVGFVKKS